MGTSTTKTLTEIISPLSMGSSTTNTFIYTNNAPAIHGYVDDEHIYLHE